jgi:hypothetical protein
VFSLPFKCNVIAYTLPLSGGVKRIEGIIDSSTSPVQNYMLNELSQLQ